MHKQGRAIRKKKALLNPQTKTNQLSISCTPHGHYQEKDAKLQEHTGCMCNIQPHHFSYQHLFMEL